MCTSTSQHGDGGYAGDGIGQVLKRGSLLATPKEPGEGLGVKKQRHLMMRLKLRKMKGLKEVQSYRPIKPSIEDWDWKR